MSYTIRTPQLMDFRILETYKHNRISLVEFENGFVCYMIGAKLKLNLEGLV